MDKTEIIESHLIRLIEDLAVVKSQLGNLDVLNMKVEASLNKMEQQAIKIEAAMCEINSLKEKVSELDRRTYKIEDSIKNDVQDTNKSYRNIAYTIISGLIGAIILYYIKPL